MKDPEDIEMNDPMDRYIGQSLKNWAAQQQPPANGRARLLLVASANPVPALREQTALKEKTLSRADHDGHFSPLASSQSPAERVIEPFAQPRLWPLHVALIPFRSLNLS